MQAESAGLNKSNEVLAAALAIFRKRGYLNVTFEEVASAAHIEPTALRTQFADKEALLNTLLKTYSPADDLEAAIKGVTGENADDLVRDTMRRMIDVAQKYDFFFDLALVDMQVNNGSALTALSARLLPSAAMLLKRIKQTDQLRPAPDLIVARTLIALLMGFVVSERAMPQMTRMALRMFPQRAWVDGMADLLIYGLVEDDAR